MLTPALSLAAVAPDQPIAEPLGRILRAYDRAIGACESFHPIAARNAIAVLRSGLELDTPEARSFDALYAWCDRAVVQRDFVGPARCLRSLRAAWCRADQPRVLMPRADLPIS